MKSITQIDERTEMINCLLYSTKRNDLNHYIFKELYLALKESKNIEVTLVRSKDEAITLSLSKDFNFFLAYSGEEIDLEQCKTLSKICGRSALIVTEDPYQLKENLKAKDIFDLIFTNDEGVVSEYQKKGRHLLIPGSKNIHYRDIITDQKNIKYDMFFSGTAWPNRVKIFEKIIQENEQHHYNLKVSLPTNKHLPNFKLNVPKSMYNWRCTPSTFASFCNTSLVTFALPRKFTGGEGFEAAVTPPPRVFEVALSGTVQLVHKSIHSMPTYFEENKHFFYYDNHLDCFKIVKDLKNNFKLRNTVAASAQQKALEYYTYENLVQNIIKEISKIKVDKVKYKISKKKILYVLHNDPFAAHFGGVEVYLREISKHLSKKYEVFFFFPTGIRKDTYCCVNYKGATLKKMHLENSGDTYSLIENQACNFFEQILNIVKPDLVHFHHLLSLPTRILEIPKKYGLKVFITLHDYYFICDSWNLINYSGIFCEVEKREISDCVDCAKKRGVDAASFINRRLFINSILAKADLVIVNTQDTASRVSHIYPSVVKRKNIIELPVSTSYVDQSHKILTLEEKNNDCLKIAILGNFTPEKGGHIIVSLIEALKYLKIEFHFFGRIDQVYLQTLNSYDSQLVKIHGEYAPGKISPDVKNCHISLHLSIWPETYCMALSESWKNGLIPIVSDIGALSERVTHGVNGFIVKYNDILQIKSLLIKIYEDKEILRGIDLNDYLVQSFSSHLEKINKHYDAAISENENSIWNFIKGKKVDVLERKNLELPSSVIRLQENIHPVFSSYYIEKTRVSLRHNGLKKTLKKIFFHIKER